MSFPELKGQTRALGLLARFIARERIPPALLFVGMEGIGKTLAALAFAKALICRSRKPGTPSAPASAGTAPSRASQGTPFMAAACGKCQDCRSVAAGTHPDVKRVNENYQAALREEDPAKQKTHHVSTIRHLRRDMGMKSMLGSWKVAVIERAHTLEIAAANALLKILEEPQDQTLWILVAPQRELLLKTVSSRCLTVPFHPLSRQQVAGILTEKGIPSGKAAALAALSEGSVSRALELAESTAPDSWADDPAAPLNAAAALPKELYLARTQVDRDIFAMTQGLRLKALGGDLSYRRVRRPLKELVRLRRALKSNVDPKIVLALAGTTMARAERRLSYYE